jgi:hypothetical protein
MDRVPPFLGSYDPCMKIPGVRGVGSAISLPAYSGKREFIRVYFIPDD